MFREVFRLFTIYIDDVYSQVRLTLKLYNFLMNKNNANLIIENCSLVNSDYTRNFFYHFYFLLFYHISNGTVNHFKGNMIPATTI